MNYIQNDTELYHHGIKGQRWGQRNGPPYPLGYNQKSSEEKSFGVRSGKNYKNNAYRKDRNQHSANRQHTNQHTNQHIENQHSVNQQHTNQQEHEARDLDYKTSKKIISLYERRSKLLSKQDKTEEKIKNVDSKIEKLNKKLGDGIQYYIVQNNNMNYSNKDKQKNYVTIIQPKSERQIEAEVRNRTLKNTKKIAKEAQNEVDRIANELDKRYRKAQNQAQSANQSSNNDKRTVTKGRSISRMTDNELKDYVNRLDWENRAYAQEMQPYNDMNKFVLNTMNDLGTVYNFVETIGRFQAKEYDFTKNPSWTRKPNNKKKNKNNDNDIDNKGNNS